MTVDKMEMTQDEAAKIKPVYVPRERWSGKQTGTHSPKYCCASVWSNGRSKQCSRAPKRQYGELGYCMQHDPTAIVEKRKQDQLDSERRNEYRSRKHSYDNAVYEWQKRGERLLVEIAEGLDNPRRACEQYFADKPQFPSTSPQGVKEGVNQ